MSKARTLYGFYQPHAPVREDRMLFNHVTGEFYTPAVLKQEFKDQCDINNIIKQFTLTGQISHISAKAATGVFMDLPDDTSFESAMNVVAKANEAFDALPAKLRDRFNNDPADFLAFVEDPANKDELIQLGIRQRPPRPAPEAGGAGGTPPAPSQSPPSGAAPGGSETPS